jgi:hypothetical protein
MNGLTHSFPMEVRASPKTRAKRDTSESCRERASADLLKSVTMLTANERLILEHSAAIWSLRAELLERVEDTARERQAASDVSTTHAGLDPAFACSSGADAEADPGSAQSS